MGPNGRTYYELLGVSPEASTEEIKEAYREIARIYHPDSQFYSDILPESMPDSNSEVFKEITAAYNVLTNLEKRREYDSALPRDLGFAEEETAGVKFHDIPEDWKKEREFFEQNYFEILKPGPKMNLTGANEQPVESGGEGEDLAYDAWEDQPPAVETVFGDLSSELNEKPTKELPLARRPASKLGNGPSIDPFNIIIYFGIPILTIVILIECYYFM